MAAAWPTGRRGQLLALGLTVICIAMLWLGAVSPLISWYGERMDVLQERATVARHMESVAGMLPALQHRMRADSAKPTSPDTLLKSASDPVAGAALQGLVQDLASRAGATLASAEILPGQAAGGYRRIGLHVSISGTQWPVLVGLLKSVAQGTPRMLVDDLQLRASPVIQLRQASGRLGGPSPIDASFTVFAFRSGKAEPGSP